MILCEWKDFLTDSDSYSLDTFEEKIGDSFEAMMFKDESEFPSIIWTTNFVVIVKRSAKMFTDLSFEKVPRNPVCE